jgi:glycosyltransferase involved in cell wall biosynthesis
MRIALVYDCLYPYTVGGAERRYRSVAVQLARQHDVTYVTRRQWDDGTPLEVPPGVRVVVVSGGRQLYRASGRRRIAPPLRSGWGVLWYLLRHRHEFDVVHVCSFPYFSLIAARLACAFGGPPVVTDWYEVWTRNYWREYLGPALGATGALVQSLCVRLTKRAFVFSQLHAARLREEGYRGEPILLKGAYAGPVNHVNANGRRDAVVVYIGRHIPEKRVFTIPAAIARARAQIPGLRATIFGDGPDRPHVLAEIARLGLQDVIRCPGFAPWEEVDAELRRAMCLVLPSRREGLGLGLVEAMARGTPAVVTRSPDNAATELIAERHNGFVAESADPDVLAHAIVAVHDAGTALRDRTQAWFATNAAQLTIDTSLLELESVYAAAVWRNGAAVAGLNGHPASGVRTLKPIVTTRLARPLADELVAADGGRAGTDDERVA